MTESPGVGRLLLDTHVLLWWLEDSAELSDELKDRIDSELEVFVSAVSLWEISIKSTLGKLDAPVDLLDWIERSGISELPIRFRHSAAVGGLPMIHRDPFDRMLVAQALTERLLLVTRDEAVQQYDVAIFKA